MLEQYFINFPFFVFLISATTVVEDRFTAAVETNTTVSDPVTSTVEQDIINRVCCMHACMGMLIIIN